MVEALSRRIVAEKPYHLRHSLCAAAVYCSQRVLLVQPLTYMNLSGLAAAEVMRCYQMEPGQMVLVYDDLDLAPGRIRLRNGGGSAGHRGVQSVIDTMGTGDFLRLRIGIGRPIGGEAADYVLRVPPPEEQELLDSAVKRAAEALTVLIDEGLEAAMNQYNQIVV